MAAGIEFTDTRFREIVSEDVVVQHLATGFLFTEGPVWVGDGLLFSDIPNRRIVSYRLAEEGPVVTTFQHQSRPNGMTLDRQGRLIVCEYGDRAITRTDKDGTKTILIDRYEGKRLNGPNDVVVKSDGAIYFSDPYPGLRYVGDTREVDPSRIERERELDFEGLFRLSPDGTTLTRLNIESLGRPNGLAFSLDESVIYLVDNVGENIRVYNVLPNGDLANGRVFAQPEEEAPGAVDGMKLDTQGNLYTTGPGGLWVYDSNSTLLGRIRPPEPPSNMAWGDADWKGLYMTARTSLYKMRLNIPGVPAGP